MLTNQRERGFLKITDQPTTYYRPPTTYETTDQPPTTDQPTKCTDDRPIDHRPVKNLMTTKNLNLYLTYTAILKHKIQSICRHALDHAHILTALGINFFQSIFISFL